MKTKEQKRKEAVLRAEKRYQTAQNSNWKSFILKYPTMNTYSNQFRLKKERYLF